MFKITAPNRAYSGSIAEVHFHKGIAVTGDLRVVDYCREAGYEVEEIIEPKTEDQEPPAEDQEPADEPPAEDEKPANGKNGKPGKTGSK